MTLGKTLRVFLYKNQLKWRMEPTKEKENNTL